MLMYINTHTVTSTKIHIPTVSGMSVSGIQTKPSATVPPRKLLSLSPLEMCRHLKFPSSVRLIGKDRKLIGSFGVLIVGMRLLLSPPDNTEDTPAV